MAYWTTDTRPLFNAEYDRQMRIIRNLSLTEWVRLDRKSTRLNSSH